MPCNAGILPEPSHAVFIPLLPIWDVYSGEVALGGQAPPDVSSDPEQELELIPVTLSRTLRWCGFPRILSLGCHAQFHGEIFVMSQ